MITILLIDIRRKVKTRQNQSYNFFFKLVKNSNFRNLQKESLHAKCVQKMFNKMYKYEMDPASIVEDTEWTRFFPQMDIQTDGWANNVEAVYPTFNFVEAGGKMNYIWGVQSKKVYTDQVWGQSKLMFAWQCADTVAFHKSCNSVEQDKYHPGLGSPISELIKIIITYDYTLNWFSLEISLV